MIHDKSHLLDPCLNCDPLVVEQLNELNDSYEVGNLHNLKQYWYKSMPYSPIESVSLI